MTAKKPPRPPIPPSLPQVKLNGVGEADFNAWKHHPVTKVVLRFLRDREKQVAEHMVAKIRTSSGAMDDFSQGAFQSHINTLRELSELEFEHMDSFYASQQQMDDEQDT